LTLDAPLAQVNRGPGFATASWSGTADPSKLRPQAGAVFIVPILTADVASDPLTVPREATRVHAWLNWTGAKGYLAFALRNATGVAWCGAGSGLLPGGGTDHIECVAAMPVNMSSSQRWTLDVTANTYTTPPQPVPYQLTLWLGSAPLPLRGVPAPFGDAAPLRFADPVTVDAHQNGNEPSVAVTPKGTIWVSALISRPGGLWRSTDGGHSFEHVATGAPSYCGYTTEPSFAARVRPSHSHVGCGDTDVATSGESDVYFTDHWNAEAVLASHDGGKTWFFNPFGTDVNAHTDRQWLVTDGPLNAWLAFDDTGPAVSKTIDGGRTWHEVARLTDPSGCVTDIARDPAGTLYVGDCDAAGPGVAVSTDGGLTFAWRHIASAHVSDFSVHITTDAAGSVYAAWSQADANGVTGIAFAASKDQGRTWTPPTLLPFTGTSVFPWPTAGAAGRVAIGFYGSGEAGRPSQLLSDWYPVVAVTQDGLAARPTWTFAAVTDRAVQIGPICTGGNECVHGRDLGDFFQIQADPDGHLLVPYVDGSLGADLKTSWLRFAKQTDGLGLGAKSVDKDGGR
jgi:hypothetical protein